MTDETAPLVTVVSVTYNAAEVIGSTLVSIQSQKMRNFEWLIVDGLSQDETLSIVGPDREVDGAHYRSVSELDRGLYDAMNKAVALAKGEYVIFINAGDSLYDDTVLSELETFLKDRAPRPAMVYGHTLVRLSDGKSFQRKVRPLEYIWHGQPTIHQAVFFNRVIHEENLYPFDRYPVSSDYAVMAKIQRKYPSNIAIWDRTVSIFDNDPNSFGNRQLWQRVKDAWNAQREINGATLAARLVSAAKRMAANVYYNVR